MVTGVDWQALGDIALRLGAASVLGALVGIERELHGHWAGLRTHIMVSLGAAMFVAASVELTRTVGNSEQHLPPVADVTRVIQGIAAGIGFLGAGTILKLGERLEIKGLTTASSIWLAAAVGTASGLALYSLAIAGTLASLIVLALLRPLAKRLERTSEARQP